MKTYYVRALVRVMRTNIFPMADYEGKEKILAKEHAIQNRKPARDILHPCNSFFWSRGYPGVDCWILDRYSCWKVIFLLRIRACGFNQNDARSFCKEVVTLLSAAQISCWMSIMEVVQAVYMSVLLKKEIVSEELVRRTGVSKSFFLAVEWMLCHNCELWDENLCRLLVFPIKCAVCLVCLHCKKRVMKVGRNNVQKGFLASYLPIFVRCFGYYMENDVWLHKKICNCVQEKIPMIPRFGIRQTTAAVGNLCCSSCMTGFSCCHRTGIYCARPGARSIILRSGIYNPAMLTLRPYTGPWRSTA